MKASYLTRVVAFGGISLCSKALIVAATSRDSESCRQHGLPLPVDVHESSRFNSLESMGYVTQSPAVTDLTTEVQAPKLPNLAGVGPVPAKWALMVPTVETDCPNRK